MKWLIGSAGGFMLTFLGYLTKKIGVRFVVASFVIPLTLIFTAGLVYLFGKLLSYFLKIYNLIKELFPKLFDYTSAGGSFGGVENSTITSSAMEFLHQSGLATALLNSMDLFITILVLFFTIKIYNILVWFYKTINDIIVTLLTLVK
ncbi:putative membrane protein [Campylobacter blaseri]|uniref:Uncharacterized protein n=1 Tax=Campylobacter blaseri TaxID=2042961 RepID=A0A2P8R2N4_9BACT|nr:hypothetical protein [Campylobacter blaseri]PSM52718.1 hypothetical protein CQ405_03030 [Campylobacter blaseri]PSM54366.1 hypothetical protein CRN67_03030 [Campylobacter blaseri]QKF86022.1 putative membrane protein [Campylobacter blaseri]